MARCGRTNLAGGGGVGSDETTATKDKVLKDYTYLGADTDDEIGTGTIESMEGTTVTPSASQQTVSTSGKYLTGDVIVSAVANLTAANIANGKVVGGTTGTYKGLGNATAAQVLAGKTFSTASLSNTTGTMKNYSGYTSTSNYTSGTFKSGTTGYIFVVPGGTGYYSNATYLRIPATNLAAGNIKKGVKILGITGTFQGTVDSPYYYLQKNSDYSSSSPTVQGGMRYYPINQSQGGNYAIGDYDYAYDHMFLTFSNGSDSSPSYVLWRLSNSAISLAAYKTLYLKVTVEQNGSSGLGTPIFGLSTSGSITGNNFNASVQFGVINKGTYSLDVSSLNSSYWFYFYQTTLGTGSRGSSGSDVYFYEIYAIS